MQAVHSGENDPKQSLGGKDLQSSDAERHLPWGQTAHYIGVYNVLRKQRSLLDSTYRPCCHGTGRSCCFMFDSGVVVPEYCCQFQAPHMEKLMTSTYVCPEGWEITDWSHSIGIGWNSVKAEKFWVEISLPVPPSQIPLSHCLQGAQTGPSVFSSTLVSNEWEWLPAGLQSYRSLGAKLLTASKNACF